MKVVIDGTSLADGSAQRGIGTYVRNLVRGLATVPDLQLSVVTRRATPLPAGAVLVPATRHSHHRLGPLLQEAALPHELRRAQADIAHSPGQDPPRRRSGPWVQTLHDLTPLVFSSSLLELEARRWRRIGGRLRTADAVIAVSQSSADQGISLLGLEASKVHVIPHGVEPTFAPGPRSNSGDPTLLFCSSWGPHKGLRELVGVFDLLVDDGLPHRLRIVGLNDAWMQSHLVQDLAACRHRDRIDVVGWVPDLAAEYRSADALLVTSRAEGFGLPAAEAMACGTPVVAFRNTSLPELVGTDSPLLVSDGDVEDFARITRLLLASPQLQQEERLRGLQRASTLTWDRSVRHHVDVYRGVLA